MQEINNQQAGQHIYRLTAHGQDGMLRQTGKSARKKREFF